jgi:3-oxoacyl-[acyl-carrier-protein] synthase III
VTADHPRVLALGEYRPSRSVPNSELPDVLDTDDNWIRERTGIAARRIAGEDETVVSMAAAAAAKALATAGVDPVDVDLVILASCSMPTPVPGGAARVAHLIGATTAGAFDINAACAGFCYGLSLAADAVRAGSARRVVVVGAEKLSDWTDWTDRRTAILFADGAGAAVVGGAAKPGIGPVVWGSDGRMAELIEIPVGGQLQMDGQAVFRWATTALAAVARKACASAGIPTEALAAVVPHQANLRIITSLARQIGAPNAVVADDIVESGNTSSASIPLALSRLVADGRVRSGDPALLLGFGAGLTWAGQVIEVP